MASRRSSSRPVRPGSRSRGGGSPSTRSCRTSSRARPSGSWSRGTERGGRRALRRGAGLDRPPGVLGRDDGLIHGSAPHALRVVPPGGTTEIEGYPGHPLPSLRGAGRAPRAALAPHPPGEGGCIALNTRSLGEAEARAAIEAPRRKRACPRTTRCGSGPRRLLEAVVQDPCRLPRLPPIGRSEVTCDFFRRSSQPQARHCCSPERPEPTSRTSRPAVGHLRRLRRPRQVRRRRGRWFFSELRQIRSERQQDDGQLDPDKPLEIRRSRSSTARSPGRQRRAGPPLLRHPHRQGARDHGARRGRSTSSSSGSQLVARTYPQVTEFVVGNEPNLTRFWQPQFDRRGRGLRDRVRVVPRRSYDALKEVNPEITVVGVGLPPRGNDMPRAKSNVSTSPVEVHPRPRDRLPRACRRDKPIMDVFGFHPYPARDRDPLAKGYRWPNAGVANLDRIKQALWDAFNGTAQPIVAEEPVVPPPPAPAEPRFRRFRSLPEPAGCLFRHPSLGRPAGAAAGVFRPDPEPACGPSRPPRLRRPLTFKLDEVGWQVAIPSRSRRKAYFGRERAADDRARAGAHLRPADPLGRLRSVRALAPALRADRRGQPRPLAGRARPRRQEPPAVLGDGPRGARRRLPLEAGGLAAHRVGGGSQGAAVAGRGRRDRRGGRRRQGRRPGPSSSGPTGRERSVRSGAPWSTLSAAMNPRRTTVLR